MKKQNYAKGKTGEEIAATFLSKHGFSIIEKNFSNRFGEIDLIATKDKWLIFVEVKLKVGEDFGSPEEMINKRKLAQIRRTAEIFLGKNYKLKKEFPQHRIDAVCIVLEKGGETKRISHYEMV